MMAPFTSLFNRPATARAGPCSTARTADGRRGACHPCRCPAAWTAHRTRSAKLLRRAVFSQNAIETLERQRSQRRTRVAARFPRPAKHKGSTTHSGNLSLVRPLPSLLLCYLLPPPVFSCCLATLPAVHVYYLSKILARCYRSHGRMSRSGRPLCFQSIGSPPTQSGPPCARSICARQRISDPRGRFPP